MKSILCHIDQKNLKEISFPYSHYLPLKTIIIFLFCSTALSIHAQENLNTSDSFIQPKKTDEMFHQRDVIDLFRTLILQKKTHDRVLHSKTKQRGLVHLSGAPSPSYSLATSFAANLTFNAAFHTANKDTTKFSTILFSPFYTVQKQLVLPIQFSIWAKNNRFNIIGDWRFLTYPEDTYGLGSLSTSNDATALDFHYVRMHTFFIMELARNLYAGPGYQLDKHWDIREIKNPINQVTDFDRYGFQSSSTSSGIAATLVYDDRANSIHPQAGNTFLDVIVRQNLTLLGSDMPATSLLIDARKYFRINRHTQNILAIWSYNWVTVAGKVPYLDLPSTGWDMYGNTGRGYVQSRFRGTMMLDLEAEYRFGILRNGLLGGVVFCNAQTYSAYPINSFDRILPGYGAGIRIKFNKFSHTNICLDYAFGLNGSNGLFVNLGEVF
ncbi:MAG: hypothetical protein JSS78_06960 [Bacteroidetes bacterium]|nr:hypothetical protein [Bacteroidota bacterium]